MTQLIDGKGIAAAMVERIGRDVALFREERGIVPSLAVVRVGEDPASAVYVANKIRACARAGIRSIERHLDADVTEAAVLDEIARLNADPDVHGILVQLPLPSQLGADRVLAAVDPAKDVDGFHVVNAGRLASGLDGPVPCTPLGCLMLLRQVLPSLAGKRAVVVGRSNIVGKPMAALLLREDCTVTIGHSRTRDLASLCREAEILVAAVGRPGLVRGDWIRPGAVVLDVGINRVPVDAAAGAGGRTRLVGDVATEEAMGIAAAITPVPGGVGPMTVACLLSNTLDAARRSAGATAEALADALADSMAAMPLP